MNCGLIGEKLGHSYSKEIHEMLGLYEYELKELPKDQLETVLQEKQFQGINVTIPYKQQVIPYLYEVDDKAKKIGAVNTIVNREGKLYGYNTDYIGLDLLLDQFGFDFTGKKVLILGTGGTAKTAHAVVSDRKAGTILHVSRSGKEGAITYEQAAKQQKDADFLINTTPCGMYPKVEESPVDLRFFPNLKGVADVIYNPLRSRLVLQADKLGVPARGGLYMLVVQAVKAAELFTGTKISKETTEKIYRTIRNEKENVVLIGMPGSGKSTVAQALSEEWNMPYIDTDKEVVMREGCEITQVFENKGEAYFRRIEREVVKEFAGKKHCIISTGGGVVLSAENVETLKADGRLYFLDRSVDKLIPTSDRPLADTEDKIRSLYQERMGLYQTAGDVRIDADLSIERVLEQIRRDRE
ncbi:MAG: shikimate kinase [Lachnospiraceae bacterium]